MTWKSLKAGSFGAPLEVELHKVCTRPQQENDLEVTIVKAPSLLGIRASLNCTLRGRRKGFDTLRNVQLAGRFEEGPNGFFSLGRGRGFVIYEDDVWDHGCSMCGTCANRKSWKSQFGELISRGGYTRANASAEFAGGQISFEGTRIKSLNVFRHDLAL